MFFKTFWDWLNTQSGHFLTDQLANLANALEPAIVTLAAVTLMVWGYLLMSGRVDRPLEDTVHRLVRLMVVLGVSTRLWGVNAILIEWFINGPAQVFAALNQTQDPVSGIDQTWNNTAAVAGFLMDHSSFIEGDSVNYFWGIALYLIGGYFCLYLIFLLTLAKIALTVVMTLAPSFMACLLFDATKQYFVSWIHELANFLLIAVLSGLMMSLLMTLVSSFAQQTQALGSNLNTTDAVDLVLACGLSILILHQIIPMAARLSGGYSLQLGHWPQQGVRLGFQAARAAVFTGLNLVSSLSEGVERD